MAHAQALALKHHIPAQNARLQSKQVFKAIREMMAPPEPKKRSIGFVVPEAKKPKWTCATPGPTAQPAAHHNCLPE